MTSTTTKPAAPAAAAAALAPPPPPPPPPFTTALIAGGIAGTTVDLSLFPLDTLKTRLQSSQGFFPSGGFRGIYRGIGSAVVGSAPGAASFFVTYEGVKGFLARKRGVLFGSGRGEEDRDRIHGGGGGATTKKWAEPVEHMVAASLGEIAACAVRVPTEVVKQRAQAGMHSGSSRQALLSILALRHNKQTAAAAGATNGGGIGRVWMELYRGWSITVMREVPFTVIQFPLWEAMKSWSSRRKASQGKTTTEVSAGEGAFFGCVAGAIAAAVTTPLDVLKTRVMLSTERKKISLVMTEIYSTHGIRPFFAGIEPRVMWISIGGGIFLGSYQLAVQTLEGGSSSSRWGRGIHNLGDDEDPRYGK